MLHKQYLQNKSRLVVKMYNIIWNIYNTIQRKADGRAYTSRIELLLESALGYILKKLLQHI